MPVSLRQLLTATPTLDGQPLFKNGLELGRIVASIETYSVIEGGIPTTYGNPYAGKEQSAVSMVNQLMRNDCGASKDFLRLILFLVENRLKDSDKETASLWVKRVKESIKNITTERKGADFYREVIENGIERALRTKDFLFIYTSIHPFASDFYALKDIMIPLLALTAEVPQASARFSFYYANGVDLYETWQRMFRDTVGIIYSVDYTPLSFNPETQDIDFKFGIEKTVAHFEELEANGFLQTFLVPEYIVSVPMVALDPLSEEPIAFIGFAAPELELGLRAMPVPEPYLSRWIAKIGKPLLNQNIPEMVNSSFSAVKDRLVREAHLAVKLGDVPDYTNVISRFSERMALAAQRDKS